ncbi:MAG: DUF4279 domain-containing protein [Chitinivorax sp.]
MDYIDDYSACESTYATLRIYPGDINPVEITKRMGIEPSKLSMANISRRSINGWFLSTKGHVESKDSRRHIDWLLNKIEPVTLQILELQKNGARMDICCFWVSATGNGGPIISSKQMKRLLPLGLDVWWDVWFSASDK